MIFGANFISSSKSVQLFGIGNLWKKVKSWFGYGLHVIADTRYEIPVASKVTRASVSEARELVRMIGDLFGASPELAQRCRGFSADGGLDSGP